MSGLRGRNVVGVLPAKGDHPSGRHVIVSAHYDHLGRRGDTIHPGAADNASGVAALLELARILAPARLDCAVVFVAFDLEEMGLLGSFAWVKHPPLPIEDCDFFVTADILGRKALGLVDGMLFAQGWEWTPEMIPVLQKVGAPDEVDVACFWTDIAGDRSDFVAFKQAKVPHLFFSTGEFPEYHTPADRAEAVDARLLARQTRVIARCLKEILGSRERWHWRETPLADPVEFASLQRLANGLFRSEDARLTANLKAQAAAMGLYAGRVLAKGKVEPVNRRWLLNVARSLQGAIR